MTGVVLVRKKGNYVDKIQQKHTYMYKNLDFMNLVKSHLQSQVNSVCQAMMLPPPPWNFWWGCAARVSKSRPSFKPKKGHFPHPFSGLASKFHTRFQN